MLAAATLAGARLGLHAHRLLLQPAAASALCNSATCALKLAEAAPVRNVRLVSAVAAVRLSHMRARYLLEAAAASHSNGKVLLNSILAMSAHPDLAVGEGPSSSRLGCSLRAR